MGVLMKGITQKKQKKCMIKKVVKLKKKKKFF